MRRDSIACAAAGLLLFAAVRILGGGESVLRDGALLRGAPGEGERTYEFSVGGLEEKPEELSVTVAERVLVGEEFQKVIPAAAGLLCERILGENASLSEVRTDLTLIGELPEYGLTVEWESSEPAVVSDTGLLEQIGVPEEGKTVELNARLFNVLEEQRVTIPVTVFPASRTGAERFLEKLEEELLRHPEQERVELPKEFDGRTLTYQNRKHPEHWLLLILGFGAAACMPLREKDEERKRRKRREDSLLSDYPDLAAKFLVLMGAGYTAGQAWKRQVADFEKDREKAGHPLCEEMEITLNQMQAGTPERRAYEEFGRRLGLSCYVKFAALLETSLSTSGKSLRKLLEEEMEAAYRQRKELARKKGEEASTKLLLPMFLLLGVVMVIVAAPAFLTLV